MSITETTINDRVNAWHRETAAMLDAAHHTTAQALELGALQASAELNAVLNVLWTNLKGLSREFDELERIFSPGLSAH